MDTEVTSPEAGARAPTAPAARPPAEATSAGDSPRMARWKRGLTLVVAVLSLLALAYGVGRMQGADAVSAVERSAAATRARLEGRTATLETELARATRRAAALEARRQLGLAMLSVDERNFGIAQGQIAAARGALRGASPFDDPGLSQVEARLAGMNIITAGDLAEQRAAILQAIQLFDQHLPAAR